MTWDPFWTYVTRLPEFRTIHPVDGLRRCQRMRDGPFRLVHSRVITTFEQTDRLAELIAGKLDCLRQLHELGQRQLMLTEQSEIAPLLPLLAAKQQWTDRLRDIQRQLVPFQGQDPSSRTWRSPEARARCAQSLQAAERLFQEILAQERHSERRLRERRDHAARQFASAQATVHHSGGTHAGESCIGGSPINSSERVR